MSQFRKVKAKVLKQAHLIFGKKDRRSNRQKRQFIESIIEGQTATANREVAGIIVTYTVARFKELYLELGPEEFFNVMMEEK